MDGVSVHRIGVHLFVVVENAVPPKWTRAHHVSVGEDVPALSIDDETCCFRVEGWVRVEAASLAEADGYDIANHILDGCLPLLAVGPQGRQSL